MSGDPVRRVTVLYDDRCNLCRTARAWLERQAQLVPLEFLAATSPAARTGYPFLDPHMTLEDLTVVGTTGRSGSEPRHGSSACGLWTASGDWPTG